MGNAVNFYTDSNYWCFKCQTANACAQNILLLFALEHRWGIQTHFKSKHDQSVSDFTKFKLSVC